MVLVSFAPVAQGDGSLVITPYRDGPQYHASVGQEVVIQAWWGACTRGLAEAFTHAASVSMEVYYGNEPFLNVEPPSREFWTQPRAFGGDTSACVMRTKSGWETEWLYSLGVLEAGQYDLHFVYTISHPLPDGGDYDGDGRPDLATPETFNIEVDITIVVE